MTDKILLDTVEAAMLLGVCEKVLREKYLKLEGFPWFQVGGKGGKIQIPRDALRDWANEYWKTQRGLEA